ncbi:response regulator transcription factor [Hydrogenimonas urashimensis]|uniref:response regulator transcription factor n=1 Tax=Hydrogenimonas urashimensis TaxID=2740515 RepID=UPI0019151AF8|nr:response regulator transcription factor [Hydrogenimonas urashimensis]
MIEILSGDIVLADRWREALKEYDPLIVERIESSESRKILIADFTTAWKEVLDYLKKRSDGRVELIVLEGVPKRRTAERLFAAGVKGYGNAYMQPIHLQSCVETVRSGNLWVYPEFLSALVEKIMHSKTQNLRAEDMPDILTPREKEIVEEVAQGKNNREIAERLGIAERTVKAHLGNIYGKLRVSNRLELALKVKETGSSTFVQ